MSALAASLPTAPYRLADMARVDELRLRLRLMRGEHRPDIETALKAMFGIERGEVMIKAVDEAANAFPALYKDLSALYVHEPRCSGPDADVIKAVARAGHWTAMQVNQAECLALGDLAIVAGESGGKLHFRKVTPDLWWDVRAKRDDPKELAYIALWIQSGNAWELHEWQVEDVDGKPAEAYVVSPEAAVKGWDQSPRSLPAQGEYSWVDTVGAAYIPVVLYHAADTGRLMDWSSGRDVTRGCIRLMVFYTDLGHLISETAWQQRILADGDVVSGAEIDETTGAQHIIADPGMVLKVVSTGDKTVQALVWPMSADPEKLFRVIAMYSKHVARLAGVRTPDATRSESDIRSGYSLAISRESIAEQQAIYAPIFRRSDQQLLHVCALLLGSVSVSPDVWQVSYQAVELGPVELSARLTVVKEGMSLGLYSKKTALLQLHPGWNEEQAEQELARIEAEGPAAAAGGATVQLAPTDLATVVTVDEARASVGLQPIGGADGALTITQYKAKYAAVLTVAANAEAGAPTTTTPATPAKEDDGQPSSDV
jgi:hypothetical protein